jgi:hypothetical protein
MNDGDRHSRDHPTSSEGNSIYCRSFYSHSVGRFRAIILDNMLPIASLPVPFYHWNADRGG